MAQHRKRIRNNLELVSRNSQSEPAGLRRQGTGTGKQRGRAGERIRHHEPGALRAGKTVAVGKRNIGHRGARIQRRGCHFSCARESASRRYPRYQHCSCQSITGTHSKCARNCGTASPRSSIIGECYASSFLCLPVKSLLVNEIAPRPHNSGHYTIDACITSQFEQQVRILCGMPLGSTAMHGAAVMVNLLGDLWRAGRAGMGTGAAASQCQTAPVRQAGSTARAQNGALYSP